MKKREKKWIQKFPENFVGKDSSEDCEERFRRIPQWFQDKRWGFPFQTESRFDVIDLISQEVTAWRTLVTPEQILFEKKLQELISKWRDFCPKIFSKLLNLTKKSKSRSIDSETMLGSNFDYDLDGKLNKTQHLSNLLHELTFIFFNFLESLKELFASLSFFSAI